MNKKLQTFISILIAFSFLILSGIGVWFLVKWFFQVFLSLQKEVAAAIVAGVSTIGVSLITILLLFPSTPSCYAKLNYLTGQC
jgi:hypothetical protein